MILTIEQRQYLEKIQQAVQLDNFTCPYYSSLHMVLREGQYGYTHRDMIISDIIPEYQRYLKTQKLRKTKKHDNTRVHN